jgi:hypothetical protein
MMGLEVKVVDSAVVASGRGYHRKVLACLRFRVVEYRSEIGY